MYYCKVYLRSVRDIYTWESCESIEIGARVEVLFRNKTKIGIVVESSNIKPAFATKPVLKVFEKNFLPVDYLDLAFDVADKTFCSLGKVLSLMIPNKFFLEENPAKKSLFYSLSLHSDLTKIKGKKQLEIISLIESLGEVEIQELKNNFASSTIKTLIEKKILKEREGDYLTKLEPLENLKEAPTLSAEQSQACDEILSSNAPTLLWGVTGSGKTEVYKSLAKKYLKEKEQMLLLVPEIGLTPQLINHFRSIFGNKVSVWHSNLSEGEKIQEWKRITSGESQILIGARSAIFVPLPNLKLIIADEEHEWTYKNEFTPRFWMHDVAEYLAKKVDGKLVFGSATPRVESLVNVEKGVWNLSKLSKRYSEVALPKINIVDFKNEAKKGNHSPFSELLIEKLTETLNKNKQAVVFLNKRGYAGATMCRFCGQTFECDSCSANMKVHGSSVQKLVCHICHAVKNFPKSCPSCNSADFKFVGWGTQQIEKILQKLFPKKRIFRADSDALGSKYAFDKLIEKFHNHEADILLGTQMIAKGLDFEKVDLVGLILADIGLNLPDFRSEERVFQLLNQVSGRAGRRDIQGQIIVQTFDAEHDVFKYLVNHDVEGFLKQQIDSRKKIKMPPFSTIAKLTFSDKSKAVAFVQAKNFCDQAKLILPREVECFWAPAFFPRIYNKYHFHVFFKSEDEMSIRKFLKNTDLSKAKVDMKPVSLL